MSVRVKITQPGIYASTGKEIAVGTELTLKKEPKAWAGRYEVISSSGSDKEAVTGEATSQFKAPFEAKDKGTGWWAIYDADNKEVKALRKDDAEIFNALSDEDKAAHVATFVKEG
jgi:hypothetical protein